MLLVSGWKVISKAVLFIPNALSDFTEPSFIITLTPPFIAIAIVGVGSPVLGSTGAPARTAIATSFIS